MTRGTWLPFGLAVAATALLSGCAGDPADQDLCAQFDDLVAAVDEVRALDPESARTADLRDAAETCDGANGRYRLGKWRAPRQPAVVAIGRGVCG